MKSLYEQVLKWSRRAIHCDTTVTLILNELYLLNQLSLRQKRIEAFIYEVYISQTAWEETVYYS